MPPLTDTLFWILGGTAVGRMHLVGVDPGEHLPRLLELLESAPEGARSGA